jgi:hypothetical protein
LRIDGVFGRSAAFFAATNINYRSETKSALKQIFHKNNFAATDNALLSLQP